MATTKILIVEDESIVALDISNRLKRMGYNVVAMATSGPEAVDKALELRPDLILMDIKLKGEMDGVDAVQQIQASLDIPVIYLTAFADEATLQRAKITGPNGYLLKPYEERELYISIEMALYKHRLERQLKESEQWLNTTLNSINEAVIATDALGQVKLMNPTAERLTGWQQQEALGKNIGAVFYTIDEQTRAPVDSPIEKMLQADAVISLTDHLLINRDGTEISINDSVAPILDEQGKIIGAVLTFQDITEKRATQARLVKQERSAAVGRLAGGVAHEFNNILTSIIGFAQLARSSFDDHAPVSRDLDQVIKQGQRAAHLVRQILDFSRKSMIQKQSLELALFLEETCKLLKHSMPKHINFTFTIDPNYETCTLQADPALIQQALTNLVSNAIDAMDPGGKLQIQLSRIATRPGESVPGQTDPDDNQPADQLHWIALIVSDTGQGIAPEHQSHIFEPFFSTKEVGQGSGLGLSQVYGIVKQHGGNIHVRSQVGQGTTVTIYLPVASVCQKELEKSKSAKSSAIPYGNSEVLLLVDSVIETSNATQATLEYLGYQVLTVSSREEAEDTFENNRDKISLVLADVTAPGVEDFTIIEALLKRNPALKIIALTNYRPGTQTQNLFPWKNRKWLQKPWTLEELAYTVNQTLQK